MNYEVIRIILLIPIVLIIVVATKQFAMKKTKKILALILCVLVGLSLVVFPFENLFFSFSTPEKLFNYISKYEIVDIVYGDNSCMIYYQTDHNTYSYAFSKKDKDGYKISNFFSYKKVSSTLDSNGSLNVYNISGTKDFYVLAAINPDADISVYDDNDVKIETNIKRVNNTNFIFFSITNLTNEHYLLIDSNKVNVLTHKGNTGNG